MEKDGSQPNREIYTSSDAEKTTSCSACLSTGEDRSAVKFCLDCSQPICQQCVDAHGRINTIRNHKLVENVNSEATKLAAAFSSLLVCSNHPEKNVELICKDHDVICCITCATVSHRNCRHLSEIASEANAQVKSSVLLDASRHLEATKRQIDEIITVHRTHNKMVESQRTVDIPMKVREMKRHVIDRLDA